MTLDTVKEAIEQLSDEDRLALETWLAEQWDAQIEQDFSPGGAGMPILEKVKAEIRAGKFARFEEGRPSRS